MGHLVDSPGTSLLFGSWLLPGLVAAVVASRQGETLLLAAERWPVPLALLGVHLVLALALSARLRAAPGARRALLCGVGLLVALGWAARLPDRAPPSERIASGPNLVLVTLDTFRADNLGAPEGVTLTPQLDALSLRGTSFTRCTATAPLTAPSHASMLSGLPALEHGLLANGQHFSVDTVIPEIRRRGYRTGAFLSSRVLDRRAGLAVGFDHYEDQWTWPGRLRWLPGIGELLPPGPASRSGDRTVSRALQWLNESERPAFLWVHLYDAHSPYLPPPAWRPGDAERAAAIEADRARRPQGEGILPFFTALESSSIETRKLMYRSAVRFTDEVVGRLVSQLPADTVLIVVADHGESLDEHGYLFNHGANLYEPSMHVPLILVWPGRVAAGARDDRLVSVAMVANTLLDAVGARRPGPTLLEPGDDDEERSCVLFTPGQQARRPVGSPVSAGRAIASRSSDGVLIVDDAGERWFDLVSDPGELSPLPPPPSRAAELAHLRALLAATPTLPDGEAETWLREIGYVE